MKNTTKKLKLHQKQNIVFLTGQIWAVRKKNKTLKTHPNWYKDS